MDMQVKVMIGVPTAGYIRHANFLDHFNALQKPEGTYLSFAHGASPAMGRNTIIKNALELQCTHVLFMDDDMVPRPESLIRLLKHDLDIVSGLYLMRNYPHFPLAFDAAFPDGKNKHMFLNDGDKGVKEVTNAGLGFVLIKTHVFKKMTEPWIRLGQIQLDGWCDDIDFFNRARRADFKIHVDLDTPIGHCTSSIVYPVCQNGVWYTTYMTGSSDGVQVPQFKPVVEHGTY